MITYYRLVIELSFLKHLGHQETTLSPPCSELLDRKLLESAKYLFEC